MRRAYLAVLAVAAACHDSVAPPTPSATDGIALVNRLESAHYIYHYAAGDSVDVAWQEQYYGWLVVQLGVAPVAKLEYNKYRNQAHLTSLTGGRTPGFAESGSYRFHTTAVHDNHETVHTLIMGYVGQTPPFFNEGVAVAYQSDPSRGIFKPMQGSRWVDDVARTALADGRVPPLDTLLDPGAFRRANDLVAYPVVGSFTRFLIDSLGVEPLKRFVHSGTFADDARTTRDKFAAVYGASLDVWWERWLTVILRE